MKKIILTLTLIMFTGAMTYASYSEVGCNTDTVFSQNNCDQCFKGGELKQGDVMSYLDDIWVNDTTNKKIMYKEEQKLPELKALNGASISKKPNDDSFWEYTQEFEALKSKELDGYVLPAGEKVSWIKSTMGAGYKVDSIPGNGQDVALMVYEAMSHNILPSGEISMNEKAHRECVLYTGGAGVVKPVEEVLPPPVKEVKPKVEQMTQVKTGPEMYFVVIMISFILGLAFVRREAILAYLKK